MERNELIAFNNQFLQFVKAFEELKQRQHFNEIDPSITIREVHVVVAIEQNPSINMARLAELIGVTRSAMTQQAKRLQKKELISIESDPSNDKNKYLKLTKKGKALYELHQSQQHHLEQAILSVLSNYSAEDIAKISHLMKQIKQVWKDLP